MSESIPKRRDIFIIYLENPDLKIETRGRGRKRDVLQCCLLSPSGFVPVATNTFPHHYQVSLLIVYNPIFTDGPMKYRGFIYYTGTQNRRQIPEDIESQSNLPFHFLEYIEL